MKLKLVVLAGAKEGLEIPLKKSEFLIGRAKECALRAGSEAISRQHCAITRHADRYTVRDLGSRNGTFVNDHLITQEVPLEAGCELRVGPLRFRVDKIEEAAALTAPTTAPASGTSTSEAVGATTPLPSPAMSEKGRKQPPVKDVAEVVQRTLSKSGSMTEDDVSRWLLGVEDANSAESLKETQSLRAEETHTKIPRPVFANESATVEDISQLAESSETEAEQAAESETNAPDSQEEGSGRWGWFKRGKGSPAKKAPGKLPPRADQQPMKDSREAAADILREMQRRR
ncbi:MAG: FHA domain-containing protein [Pirellulales bacterium]|nr:FHA domain-containing protein [Pirellulales bacterium]